jgi:hypothetical protein
VGKKCTENELKLKYERNKHVQTKTGDLLNTIVINAQLCKPKIMVL